MAGEMKIPRGLGLDEMVDATGLDVKFARLSKSSGGTARWGWDRDIHSTTGGI